MTRDRCIAVGASLGRYFVWMEYIGKRREQTVRFALFLAMLPTSVARLMGARI